MPRSGTSWLAQIFASHPEALLKLDPLFSYSFKNAIAAESSDDEWLALFAAVATTADEYMDQDFLRRDGLVPTFDAKAAVPSLLAIKANRHHGLLARMLELPLDLRLVLVVRDPRTTIASWVNNPTEFPADADIAAEWRSGSCRKGAPGEYWGFDDWLAVTRQYVDLASTHPEQVRVVRYEDLLHEPVQGAAELLGWCGLAMHPQTEAFLTATSTEHDDRPRSVFKAPDQLAARPVRLDPAIQQEIVADTIAAGLEHYLDSALDRVQP